MTTQTTTESETRDRRRNYIGTNGREVYWRSKEQHGATKDKIGWTCSYCAQFESECICEEQRPAIVRPQ